MFYFSQGHLCFNYADCLHVDDCISLFIGTISIPIGGDGSTSSASSR